MMRTIEFRIWDNIEGKMIYKDVISSIGIEDKYINYYGEQQISDTEWEQAQFTCTDFELMQYTGSLDKNGTKIFEGDIISFRGEIGEVKYYPEMVGYEARTIDGFIVGPHFKKSEVIGNIFKNPELLKDV